MNWALALTVFVLGGGGMGSQCSSAGRFDSGDVTRTECQLEYIKVAVNKQVKRTLEHKTLRFLDRPF